VVATTAVWLAKAESTLTFSPVDDVDPGDVVVGLEFESVEHAAAMTRAAARI
jgi:hypothetical protein